MLLALLVFLGGLLLLVFGTILALLIQAGTFNGVPSVLLAAVSFPDWLMFVSEGLVDATIGVAIGYVLWRKLGQKKQNTIAEAEEMMKFENVRVTERKEGLYLINLTENAGFKIPFWARGLAEHGIIQQADEKKLATVKWNETEASKKDLGLT